ncbi:MAG: COG4648 family protein [Burkholderiales bacterium]
MFPAGRTLSGFGVAAAMFGYALLANYTNQSGNATLGVAVALSPLLLALLLFAGRSPHRLLMLSLIAVAGTATILAWPLLKRHYGWIYWMEHEALQLTLFATFARTLFAGRQPLCARYAEIMHGSLNEAHRRYARSVTVAWTVFFGIMIAVSTSLFFLFPLGIWSIFSNFVFLPLVALMFIAEFAIRKRVLTDIRHTGVMETVRTYRKMPGQLR